MRILHVSPYYWPATGWGGPIFSTLGLVNATAASGEHELFVLTTDAAGKRLSQRVSAAGRTVSFSAGYKVRYARRSFGKSGSPSMIWHLLRAVRAADIVHLTATYSFPTLPTLLVCKLLRKPVVWSPRGAIQATHEWKEVRRPRLKLLWERCALALLPKRSLLHVTAEVEREACAARLPGVPAVVIPNGVEVPSALPNREWRPGGKGRLMFLSRLDVKKGLENLLDAIALVPEVTLDVYGAGEPSYVSLLQQRVANLRLGGRVTFHGHVDGDAKTVAFSGADLFVLPSFSENFGIVVAEALAHGVPVLASKGTPWHALEEQTCGMWVDNEPKSLAMAIRSLLHKDLHEMGVRGRQWMERDFRWEQLAVRMTQAYQDLVALPA